MRRPGDLERQMFFYEVFQKILKPAPPRPIAIAGKRLFVVAVWMCVCLCFWLGSVFELWLIGGFLLYGVVREC